MKVHHNLVIEDQEYDAYHAVTKDNPYVNLILLDKQYQHDYDAYDKHGMSRSKGSGPARNFIWDHSIAQGFEYHWIMDDNIRSFQRWNKNLMIKVKEPTFFRVMEDFVKRYENVAMAGPQYVMFAMRKDKRPPFIHNTRIYSCNFIRNDVPFRWRGRYNEDTDLSLRMLKAGWCTILFNAFLQQKVGTQRLKGGNTDELYAKGTYEKSKMITAMHPDCCRMVKKWNRWHHYVDYDRFKRLKLIKKDGIKIKKGVDNYGLKLSSVSK